MMRAFRECVESFGGRVLMTRDDHPSGSDRLAEAAGLLNLAPEDIVINIQGDQPVFPPDLISQLAAVLSRDPGVVMVTPVKRREPTLRPRPTPTPSRWSSTGPAAPSISPAAPCLSGGTATTPIFTGTSASTPTGCSFSRSSCTCPPGAGKRPRSWSSSGPWSTAFPFTSWRRTGDTREVDSPEDARQVEEFLRR